MCMLIIFTPVHLGFPTCTLLKMVMCHLDVDIMDTKKKSGKTLFSYSSCLSVQQLFSY